MAVRHRNTRLAKATTAATLPAGTIAPRMAGGSLQGGHGPYVRRRLATGTASAASLATSSSGPPCPTCSPAPYLDLVPFAAMIGVMAHSRPSAVAQQPGEGAPASQWPDRAASTRPRYLQRVGPAGLWVAGRKATAESGWCRAEPQKRDRFASQAAVQLGKIRRPVLQ